MIDRIVHDADDIALKGASYRINTQSSPCPLYKLIVRQTQPRKDLLTFQPELTHRFILLPRWSATRCPKRRYCV